MLSDFPGGGLAPNARYWLGECRYAVGDYQGALAEFARGFADYPDSNKAPDCLLKMSYSQSRLGDGPAAMESLRLLLTRYPDSPSAGLIRNGRARFSGP
jgi:tol-pal system protein YbgF